MSSLYAKNKKAIAKVKKHYKDCPYKGRFIPMNVCACDCYERRIFTIGVKAQKNLERKL